MGAALQSIRYEPTGRFEATRYEKVDNVIIQGSKQGLLKVAKEISDLIRVKPVRVKNLFWVRAEDRNKETAKRYQSLDLASYAAMEAFVRYDFLKV
ncbi:hypothetical protein [Flagellimonas ruestringensis]|uniref:hypothetical protein n=1 Tax=Flagellimonas ruestringensis TaxID=111501 RepID=UPI0002D95DF3|nr:hypothetical protein [Allomuricauda ruestringensis]